MCPFEEDWVRAWVESFVGRRGWLGPVAYHHASDPSTGARAFAAFAKQSIGPLRVTSLAGYYWPYRGIGVTGCVAPDGIVRQLAEVVTKGNRSEWIRMGPLVSDDWGTLAFIDEMKQLGWHGLKRSGGVVLRLELPAGLQKLSECISPSLSKNLTYLRRRLDKQHGAVSSTRFVLGPDSAPDLLERLARLEAASWVTGEGGDPKFVGLANQRFWASVNQSRRSWQPVVWILQVGTSDVAFSLHLETSDTVWIVANSYDAAWRPHSPGSLLTLDLLKHAVLNGFKLVDWGQGDSGYKSRWGANPAATLDDYLLFAPGMAGLATYSVARAALRAWTAL